VLSTVVTEGRRYGPYRLSDYNDRVYVALCNCKTWHMCAVSYRLVDYEGCSPLVALHLKQTRDIDFKPALVVGNPKPN